MADFCLQCYQCWVRNGITVAAK